MGQLTRTPGFTLEHLQFLVVDETDRLLRQSYQDWLPLVLAAAAGGGPQAAGGARGLGATLGAPAFAPPPRLRTRRGLTGSRVAPEGRLCKLVVSATLSRDPAKMGRLELHSPVYFVAGETGQRCASSPTAPLNDRGLRCCAKRVHVRARAMRARRHPAAGTRYHRR